MTLPIAVACAAMDQFENIRDRLIAVGKPADSIEPERLRCKEDVLDWLGQGTPDLLVLHEELPVRKSKPDRTGGTALGVLRERQDFGRLTPTLVITASRNPASELESYCTPPHDAIAMPDVNLKPQHAAILKGILGMIGPQRHATWTVLEIVVRDRYCKCLLGDDSGQLFPWAENAGLPSIQVEAIRFEKPDAFKAGWLSDYDRVGRQLFDSHVIGPLGRSLFAHIENAAGGLTKLAFRFKIEEPALYPVPFEASVRAMDEDPGRSHFVRLYAPLARWLPQTGVLRAPPGAKGRLPDSLRVLVIRSQVCEHPEGATKGDTLDVEGGTTTLTFKKLESMDGELMKIGTLAGETGLGRIALTPLDLSRDCEPGGAAALLEATLTAKPFDIVHFAGHSWSSSAGITARTVLVLPGAAKGQASKFDIGRFARLAGQAGARLVYLSSCRGSSARSIVDLVQHGVQHAVGFRCDVNDAKAATFATDFYEALFRPSPIPAAFQIACSRARDALDDDGDDPIWASPMLVAQSSDWAARF